MVVGLCGGAMSALLGVGAGLFLLPLMAALLRLRAQRANATSLAVVIPTSLVAAFRYHQNLTLAGQPGISGSAVLWLALGSVFGGVIGTLAANALGFKKRRRLLGLPVLLLGAALVSGWQVAAGGHPSMGVLGLGVGTLGGLLGLGGGVIMVPALVLLAGYDQHLAQGVSLAVIVPVSLFGTLIHIANRRVLWDFAGWLTLGAVCGAWVVSGMVDGIPALVLRWLFAAFTLWEGGRLLLGRAEGQETPPARKDEGDQVGGPG